tara:strand:+ start:508 stop:939 length:432 start_codon:yes stop_codon:yes gene_type:complete
MKIAIGCDHAAFIEKQKVLKFLGKLGHVVIDVGTYSNVSVNYPLYGHDVANKVVNDEVDKGIVICGSGIGISIAANKIKGARAALCTSVDHAEMSRKHNDANILALGARMTEYKLIEEIISVWLKTEFEGGRHLDRINMIEKI